MKIKKVADVGSQSHDSKAFKFFSTSVLIQVLLALYLEADSISWQLNSVLK